MMKAARHDPEPWGNAGPTVPPPSPADLGGVLVRNIQALDQRRRRDETRAGPQARIADAITRFTGSMAFVYIHLVIFGLWTACNVGIVPGVKPFDPTFVFMATEASVEAIFLSTFVLISQNRAAAAADRRADLDLQINLLAEHEITRLLKLTVAVAERVGVDVGRMPELGELQRDVAPEAVLDELEDRAPQP